MEHLCKKAKTGHVASQQLGPCTTDGGGNVQHWQLQLTATVSGMAAPSVSGMVMISRPLIMARQPKAMKGMNTCNRGYTKEHIFGACTVPTMVNAHAKQVTAADSPRTCTAIVRLQRT
jgi:hypothetical protein